MNTSVYIWIRQGASAARGVTCRIRLGHLNEQPAYAPTGMTPSIGKYAAYLGAGLLLDARLGREACSACIDLSRQAVS